MRLGYGGTRPAGRDSAVVHRRRRNLHRQRAEEHPPPLAELADGAEDRTADSEADRCGRHPRPAPAAGPPTAVGGIDNCRLYRLGVGDPH